MILDDMTNITLDDMFTTSHIWVDTAGNYNISGGGGGGYNILRDYQPFPTAGLQSSWANIVDESAFTLSAIGSTI